METKDILLLGGIGIGAYFLLNQNTQNNQNNRCGTGNPTFTITAGQYPNVQAGVYCESDLPGLGFVRMNNQWYHNSQLVIPNQLPQNAPPPPTTNTSSPNYIAWVQQLLNLGVNIYTNISGAIQKMKTTSANWNMSEVNVDIAYSTNVIRQAINPTTIINRTAPDGTKINMSFANNQTRIDFVNSQNQIVKTGIIDWYNERLQGFDAGSISGIGSIGQIFLTVDVNKNKIGSIYNYKHPAQLTKCADGTYSDSTKGSCSYHGGSAEIEYHKPSKTRAYVYNKRKKTIPVEYKTYRKQYKSDWARKNRNLDRTITL